MALEIALNEGKQYVAQNAISGRTVYAGLIYGQTVAGATIVATSVLSGLQEDTAVTRVPVVMGVCNSSGIMLMPAITLVAGSGGHANAQALFIASAAAGGVGIYVWDLPATYDMSATGATLVTAALNYFYKNPGE